MGAYEPEPGPDPEPVAKADGADDGILRDGCEDGCILKDGSALGIVDGCAGAGVEAVNKNSEMGE